MQLELYFTIDQVFFFTIFLFCIKNGLQLILARLPTDIIDYPALALTSLTLLVNLVCTLICVFIISLFFANFTLHVLFAFVTLTIFTAVTGYFSVCFMYTIPTYDLSLIHVSKALNIFMPFNFCTKHAH